MIRSFYLAAPSRDLSLVDPRVNDLEERGLLFTFDWREPVREKQKLAKSEKELDDKTKALCALNDIDGIHEADVFVACTDLLGASTSRGTHIEIGARFGMDREAHLVGHPNDLIFYNHPLVHHHETWAAFLTWLDQAIHDSMPDVED